MLRFRSLSPVGLPAGQRAVRESFIKEETRWPAVDAQDLAILGAFARDPRATYGEVGGGIGLSGNAVKSRVRRMTDEGVLGGFPAIPEPAFLGLAEGLLVFGGVDDLDEREEEILRSLPDVAGVVFVDVALDHTVYVWTLHGDDADLDRIERAAISLVGKPPAYRVLGAPPPPAAEAPDWRVARALLPDARASLKELSVRSGLSFKTLKRRLRGVIQNGLVRIEPVLSGTDASGAVLFRLVLVLREGADASAAAAALPRDAIVTRAAGGRVLVAEMQRPTLRAAQDAQRLARATTPDVERCFLQIATRRRFAAWLDEALAARAAAAKVAAAAPKPAAPAAKVAAAAAAEPPALAPLPRAPR